MQNNGINILRINSSSRTNGSYSTLLADEMIATLKTRYNAVTIKERDISKLEFLSDMAVEAMFVPAGQRTLEQSNSLSLSDELVSELKWSDVVVIALPIYNFNIPAALKAYFDLTVRINETFVHTAQGSSGLLANKKAYVVVTSAGTTFKSKVDFASGYIEFILSFIGIKDIELIDATQIAVEGEDAVLNKARQQIQLLHRQEMKAVA